MRFQFNFVLACLVVLSVLPVQAQEVSISTLENQIKGEVAKHATTSNEKTSVRELNLLKHQLLSAIEADLDQLGKDSKNQSLSSSSRSAIQSAVKERQAEYDSITDSLGQWTTGLDLQGTVVATTSTTPAVATPSTPAIPSTRPAVSNAPTAATPPTGTPPPATTLSATLPSATPSPAAPPSTTTPAGTPPPATTSPTVTTPPTTSTPAAASSSGGNTLFTRSTVGVTLAAANGATPTARFFVDFALTAPLFGAPAPPLQFLSSDCQTKAQQKKSARCKFEVEQIKRNVQFRDPLGTRVWIFWNPRLTSVAQSNVAIGAAASGTSTIFQNAATSDLTKLVQTLEMEQGFEVRLLRGGSWMPDNFGKPSTTNGGTRVGLFLFGSYGVGVPVSGFQNVTTVYLGNNTLDALYAAPAGTQFIAVEERNKDRFYRDFYLGFRLKTFNYGFSDCSLDASEDSAAGTSGESEHVCPQIKNQFPGTYEVAWGQDDSINGQTLTGGVVRIRGFYPLPFYSAVHLFGGVNLSLKHKTFVNGAEFVLAPGNITPTSTGVFQAAVNPPARDRYQFGVGIDLIEVYKAQKSKAQQQNSTTGTPATNAPSNSPGTPVKTPPSTAPLGAGAPTTPTPPTN